MIVVLSTFSFLLAYISILTISAFGGMFSEKSGTLALSLEGSMTFGAFAAGVAMHLLPATLPDALSALIVILIALISAGLFSLLLALACVTFKANQTLVGTALNILSTAIAVVLIKHITRTETLPVGNSRLNFTRFYEIFNVDMFGIQGVKFNWLILIVLVLVPIVYLLIYKTQYGLRLSACGENPSSADSLGINVNRTRYTGIVLSGLFAGLGGLLLITMNAEWEFANGANGFGYLALAVLIFGQWKPLYIFLGAFIFSIFKTLSVVYPSIDILANLGISSYFYLALPYVVCLVVLIFTSKKNAGPKTLGEPYDKGKIS
ncbi:MAG: ABC transporter permease [Bacilli bacterium]|nr:ABC transporter permease [Bacilli bacterium]